MFVGLEQVIVSSIVYSFVVEKSVVVSMCLVVDVDQM